MSLSRRHLLAASPLLLLPTRMTWAGDADSGDSFQELTPQSRRSVRRGNDWLMKTMNRDGGCGIDIGQTSDIGCTAIVGLSLMSQGNTPVEGPYSRQVRKITTYLLRAARNMPAHDITNESSTQLQNELGPHAHSFFAALYFSQVMGEGRDPMPIRRALKKVVKVIVAAQRPDGHWGLGLWASTLGTVTGWVSLRAANFVGVKVGGSPQKTVDHLLRRMKRFQRNRGDDDFHPLYINAAGVRVLYSMKREEEEIFKKALRGVQRQVTRDNSAFSQGGGEEFLAFHLITETMLKKEDADWRAWFPVVRDKLIAVQNRDGSWTGHQCITSRTFCTAAANLVLTAPNRYLPISQP